MSVAVIAEPIHRLRHATVEFVSGNVRTRTCTTEMMTRDDELQYAERHADAGGHETDAPAINLREPSGDQRADERTDIDAHVEDGESRITSATALRVEFRNESGDVRLQQSYAEDDHDEPEVEHLRRLR